jgi:peptide/nickel transport system permease protein
MLSFLLRRLVSGLVVLVAVASLTFVLLYTNTGSIARNILGEQATAEQIAAKEAELGLDQSLGSRLLGWFGDAAHGDFGRSWFNREPVVAAIVTRLPVTLTMVVVAILLIGVAATGLGLLAAVRRGWVDRLVQVGAVAGSAVPAFLIGLVLVTVVAIQLGWLPAISTITPGAGPGVWVASLTLPVVALLVNGVTTTAQQIRSAVIRQLELDHVRTLRSRGVPEREILLRHVLRSAAPAGLTVLSLQFIGMLSGVVILEQIFALPGIGQLAVQSTTSGDLPLVMGVVVYTVLIVIVVNLLVDLVNGWLNPKVRVS